MTNVFISYARLDGREVAVQLRDAMQKAGYAVWLDTRQIEAGGDFTVDIQQAVDECDVMLALVSEGANLSKWCRMEQLRALRKGKKLIPLTLYENTEPPLHLEHLNTLSYTNPETRDAILRDLLSDIASSQAFRAPKPEVQSGVFRNPAKTGRVADEKRNAPAFRRHIRTLRAADWGGRNWWTYFLFRAMAMQEVVHVLEQGELRVPAVRSRSQWDRMLGFHFRPRPPQFFEEEGFLPGDAPPGRHLPVPVVMLFDLETLLLHPESRFSDGDPRKGASTFATPSAFAELPFEMIYHDHWLRTDEREEILRYREAQVLIPNRVSLESLQYLWVRSHAEYETLRHSLTPAAWARWSGSVTTRTDMTLFNHRRPYIRMVNLAADSAVLRVNPCQTVPHELYALVVSLESDTTTQTLLDARMPLTQDVTLHFSAKAHYTLKATINGHPAYHGVYASKESLL